MVNLSANTIECWIVGVTMTMRNLNSSVDINKVQDTLRFPL